LIRANAASTLSVTIALGRLGATSPFPSRARIAATGVFGLVAARTQHQAVEQRRIPAMANVM
jgi:hypothetical protein